MKNIKDILEKVKTNTLTVEELYLQWDHKQEVGFVRLLKEAVKLGLLEIHEVGDKISDHIVFLTDQGAQILKKTIVEVLTNVTKHVSEFGSKDKEKGTD